MGAGQPGGEPGSASSALARAWRALGAAVRALLGRVRPRGPLDLARGDPAGLAALLDAVPVPLFVTRDPGARRIEANRAAQELVGIAPGENASLGAPPGERARFVPMKDGVPIPVEELPMQAAARFGRETRELEYDIVRPDGSVRRVVASARPIVDAHGVRRGAAPSARSST